jgi:hypothetical protein
MAKSKKEAGQEYLKQVIALIPEAQRQVVQEALSADTAVEALGSPFHEAETRAEQAIAEAAKIKGEVGAYKQNLDKWYTDTQGTFGKQQAELEAKLKAATTAAANPDLDAPKLPANLVTKEDLTKQVADMIAASERGGMGAIAYFTTLGVNHFNKFGEALDVNQLVANATQAGKTVPAYYQEMIAPRLAEMEKKSAAEAEAKIRKDEREKVQAELRKQEGHRAYPLPGSGTEDPSTLGGLTKSNGKDANPEYGVKAALDAFFAKGQNL